MLYAIEPAPPRRSVFEATITGSFLFVYFSIDLITWMGWHVVNAVTGAYLEPAEPVDQGLT